MKKLRYILALVISVVAITAMAQTPIEFSKAGFLNVPNSGRSVFDFNVGWRFIKTNIDGAHKVDFDDSEWEVVNCPHGLELVPTEASGCINYQGPAWYRKHFVAGKELAGKELRLHFEGVMGKAKVWINGELVKENFGGFLPFGVNISGKLKIGEENVIAVLADNSNDPDFPPGTPQDNLDFSYFGGIYRDVWMIATESVFVTTATDEQEVAGGGVLVHYENLSDKKVDVIVKTHIRNNGKASRSLRVNYILKDTEGNIVAKRSARTSVVRKKHRSVEGKLSVKMPNLWSPQNPYQYRLEVLVTDSRGKKLDGVALNAGIRKIEMRGKDGFWLNNKPYEGKLIGVNRHQDHAYVGNALSNSGQWRDALFLKKGGSDIVRAAHYPVDPAFMEACDALGMFYIVATPGWQFWNKKPIFAERVHRDIRNMIRRDRNHACILMWEPILNETWYPVEFAKATHETVHSELPYQGTYTVCDSHAKGQEFFDVIYSHPFKSLFYRHTHDNTPENVKKLTINYDDETRCIFTREWGDSVDDWASHNSPSRVARNFGERAQLIQLRHYSAPDYVYTCWETLYRQPRQHIGGTLWHSFDHQRGGHPDPFYGGIADIFRLPKYSYYMFKSQVSPKVEPMVFVAHEMTPFSESDVTVVTNCDEVRLIVYEKDTLMAKPDKANFKMPHPVVVFKDVFNFMDVKTIHRAGKKHTASFVAEGLVDGKVVARFKRMPAKKPTSLKVVLENKNVPLIANGSDVAVVTASIVDQDGIIKRLSNHSIGFEIEGEAELVGDYTNGANPRRLEWGQAPIMIRTTTKPGKVKIKAFFMKEGVNMPLNGELEFETIASPEKMIYSEVGKAVISTPHTQKKQTESELELKIKELERTISKLRLEKTEKQQEEFEAK